MHLSPDEIERRAFAIEDRGYDRDEVRVFLLEVASALRLALHTTRPPTASAPPATAVPIPADTPSSADDFARLGSEVAEVLRSAHDAVAALHHQADAEIAARHDEARADADEIRRHAETDANWTHDRAKRVLITAQEQADAIVAEAEANAAELLTTARRQAREHADQVATRTRRHAEQILRAEREALRRLHQAQAGVAAAVEMLTGSETRPIVDLTELRPNVRLGPLSLEPSDTDPVRSTEVNDPVARMVRNAVDRASQHAQETGTADPPGAEPERDPRGAADDDAAESATTEHDPATNRRLASTDAPSTRVAAGRATVATQPAAAAVTPVAPVRVVRPSRPDADASTAVGATTPSPATALGSSTIAGRATAPRRVAPPSAGGTEDGPPRAAR